MNELNLELWTQESVCQQYHKECKCSGLRERVNVEDLRVESSSITCKLTIDVPRINADLGMFSNEPTTILESLVRMSETIFCIFASDGAKLSFLSTVEQRQK